MHTCTGLRRLRGLARTAPVWAARWAWSSRSSTCSPRPQTLPPGPLSSQRSSPVTQHKHEFHLLDEQHNIQQHLAATYLITFTKVVWLNAYNHVYVMEYVNVQLADNLYVLMQTHM